MMEPVHNEEPGTFESEIVREEAGLLGEPGLLPLSGEIYFSASIMFLLKRLYSIFYYQLNGSILLYNLNVNLVLSYPRKILCEKTPKFGKIR
jgi:hypothetical protein